MSCLKSFLKLLRLNFVKIRIYIFFLLPLLLFFYIGQFHIVNRVNIWHMLALLAMFIIVVLYGLYKYLEVEYIKQQYKIKYKKRLEKQEA